MNERLMKSWTLCAAIAAALVLVTAGRPLAQRAQPVATGEGERPGLRVEVTELKRTSGDTLTLRMTLINESDEPLNFSDLANQNYDLSGGGHAIGAVHLIDPVGKRKYFVARDSANKCVCSAGLVGLARGRSLNVWAKFSAPPDGVERLTVVIPQFLPIEDVPLSR